MVSDLQTIPGVGKELEKTLLSLGVRSVKDLKGKNPEVLYKKLCEQEGKHIDRCVLYVFRCSVYFASNHPQAGKSPHNPELLKWWNWKDRKLS